MSLPAQTDGGGGGGVVGEIGLISLPPKPCGKYKEKLYAHVSKKTWINTNYCIHKNTTSLICRETILTFPGGLPQLILFFPITAFSIPDISD